MLLVAQAQNLSEATLYAIDQFVMRGGRLMAMVDPHSEAAAAAPVQQTGSGGWNFGELPASTDDADEKYVDQLLKAGKNGISDGALMQRVGNTINEVRGNARR